MEQLSPVHSRGRIVIAAYVVAVLVFGVSLARIHRSRTGFTTLINFGGQFHERKLPAVRDVLHYVHAQSGGYDGQFYAQLAVEPLLRDRAIDRALDTPPYRARRILFAWTAYLMGLGRPAWIIHAYAWQNILAWALLAALLLRWLPPTSWRNFVTWFACLFGYGLIGSVMLALLEGPSLVLIALAVLASERGRRWVSAAVLGLAGLGRETNLVAGGAVVDRIPRTRDELLRLAGLGAIMVLPYLLWSLYVRSIYPAFRFSNPASFSWPLAGYLGKWWITLGEFRLYGSQSELWLTLAVLIGITIQAGYLLVRRNWTNPWWRVGAAYAVVLPFLSPLVWDGYPGAAGRVVVPISFAFNILLARDDTRWFWLLAILGNLSVLVGLHDLRVPLLSLVL